MTYINQLPAGAVDLSGPKVTIHPLPLCCGVAKRVRDTACCVCRISKHKTQRKLLNIKALKGMKCTDHLCVCVLVLGYFSSGNKLYFAP